MERLKSLSSTLFLLLVLTSLAHADIVSFTADDGGVGSIAGGQSGPFTVDLTKDYTALGAMELQFSVNSAGIYLILEDIVNNTGIDWTDFHWAVSEEFGDVSIVNVIGTGPFPNINPLPDTQAWIDGGVLADGQVLVTQIEVLVQNQNGGLFVLQQHPTIPIPAALWLLAPTLGLLSIARRRVPQ